MSAIQKVTPDALTKQTSRKNLLWTINLYILQLLLNLATARTEVLVSGNKSLCTYVKEICHP
jgi:hypothetical protein